MLTGWGEGGGEGKEISYGRHDMIRYEPTGAVLSFKNTKWVAVWYTTDCGNWYTLARYTSEESTIHSMFTVGYRPAGSQTYLGNMAVIYSSWIGICRHGIRCRPYSCHLANPPTGDISSRLRHLALAPNLAAQDYQIENRYQSRLLFLPTATPSDKQHHSPPYFQAHIRSPYSPLSKNSSESWFSSIFKKFKRNKKK